MGGWQAQANTARGRKDLSASLDRVEIIVDTEVSKRATPADCKCISPGESSTVPIHAGYRDGIDWDVMGYFALEATPEGRLLVVFLRNERHRVTASRTRGDIVAPTTQTRCKRRRGSATTCIGISVCSSAALSNARSTATRHLFSKPFDKRHAGMACGCVVNLETATTARIVFHHGLSRHARFANSLIDCKNRRSFDIV